jgi:predicted permease
MAAYEDKSFRLITDTSAEHIDGEVVSERFFDVLGVPPQTGSTVSTHKGPTAVVSHALWTQFLRANSNIIGQSIDLDGSSYLVIGIMPPEFEFPSNEKVWISAESNRADIREELAARANSTFQVVARLKPGVTVTSAQAELDTVARDLALSYPESNRSTHVVMLPLHEAIVGDYRPALLILMESVLMVLLIACVNIATLLLVRSTVRSKEIAVRLCLGATLNAIARLILTESMLLAISGGVLGILLAFASMHALISWSPKDIPRLSAAHIDPLVLGFAGLITAFAGVLFGAVPAWRVSRGQLNQLLRGSGRGETERSGVSRLLLAGEIALSLILLVAAGLLAKSLRNLEQVDVGFRADHLLTLHLDRSIPDSHSAETDASNRQFYQKVIERTMSLPGVEVAATTISLPMEGRTWVAQFDIAGAVSVPSERPSADVRIVGGEFFDALRIPVLRGRTFTNTDTEQAPHVAVINESLSRRYWNTADPIGRRVVLDAFGAGMCEIVGVVGDVRETMTAQPSPQIFLPSAQEPMPWQTLIVRSKSSPAELAGTIRREIQQIDPEQPVTHISTMEQVIQASIEQAEFRTMLLGSFAGLALLLSAIGVYGVTAYSVARRTREVGVRIAVGASRIKILRLIIGQTLVLTLAGVGLGFVGSVVVLRVLNSVLFRVHYTDPATFVEVTVLLCAMASLASCIPALRAMRVDPVIALRYE